MTPDLNNSAEVSEFSDRAVYRAVHGLRVEDPLRSASTSVIGWQRAVLWGLLVVVIAAAVAFPYATVITLIGLCTLGYVLTMVDRMLIFRQGLASRAILVTDDEAQAIPDAQLPSYTILVPAYNEPEVVGNLVSSLSRLDYPPEKLQVLLLLEADDAATIAAAQQCAEIDMITVLLVPAAEPRTKPKACNYGLCFATGDIVTIYDAEDLPEPLQLRRAVAAFHRLPDNTACVQAKLAYHNGHQNMLTGWFTAEYALWFGYLLPGMMVGNSPIPLGGTSNHLRRSVLDQIGAWDPYNVTEDADLGLRISASGYQTAVVDSVTLEEANSDLINWIRQRSRWYKGYLQTWLVHMRRPRKLMHTIGFRGFLRFNLVLCGTPVIAVLNLVFWFLTTMWFLGQPHLITEVFPWYTYFPALVALVIGNAATIYMNLVTLCEDDRPDLLVPALTVPVFWLIMSVAAAKGMYQLLRKPFYWEKTAHGLAEPPPVSQNSAS